MATIRLGTVLPRHVLSYEDVRKAKKIELEYISSDPAPVTDGGKYIRTELNLKVKNIYHDDFETEISWTSSNHAWQVRPSSKRVHFPAGSETIVPFKLHNTDPSHLYPLPEFSIVYPTDEWGECKVRSSFLLTRSAKVKRTRKAPAIDGKLNDHCWSEKHLLGPLYGHGGRVCAVEPTDVYLSYDDESFYIGVRCTELEKGKIRAFTEGRDDRAITSDDSILVFIDADNEEKRMHELIVNPSGTILDQIVAFEDGNPIRDIKWNGDWKIGLGEEETAWTLEVAVPYETLETKPERGTVWGFNIARIQPKVADRATWQTYITIHPAYFGKITMR